MPPVEQYQSPRRPKAEAHRALIEEMRRANWPLRAIRERLAAEHGVSLTVDALWKFCQSRGIQKGELPPAPPSSASPPAGSAGEPPPVRRNRVGSDGLTIEERIAKARREREERDAKYDLGLSYKGGPLTLKTAPPSKP